MENDIEILDVELGSQNSDLPNDLGTYFIQILLIIDNFICDYFQDEYEVIKFNKNFIEDNQLAYRSDIDFLQMMRFISTAYNTMKANSSKAFTPLVVKYYEDITNLEHIYRSFNIKVSKEYNIFATFVKSVGDINGIIKLVEKSLQENERLTLSKEDNEEIKNFIKKEFYISLEKEISKYRSELKSVINTKMYYYNELFWNEMNKDISIREFYKENRDRHSKEKIGLSFFIEKYLQGVNISVSKESEAWFEYLHKVVKVID